MNDKVEGKTKDILDGEICELIAAQAVERGFKSEWVLTLRYETHVFKVKAFAEHERLFRAAGFYLPDRLQGERKFLAPYSVVVSKDEARNSRRVIAIFNQYGEIRKLEDYLQRETPKAAPAPVAPPAPETPASAVAIPAQSPLDTLKSSLDTLLVQYPHDSIERGLIANMLMGYAVLSGGKPLVAKPKYAKREA